MVAIRMFRGGKLFLFVTTALITATLLIFIHNADRRYQEIYNEDDTKASVAKSRSKVSTNWRGLNASATAKLSKLGRFLFLEENVAALPSERSYEILVWKYGKTIEARHLKNFGEEYIDPFRDCSVKNCRVTFEDAALRTADIVLFHLHRMKTGDLPTFTPPDKRRLDQIWAFLTDESPYHAFMNRNSLSNYDGIFNWSMTYRMDSDIPVPYGRTVPKRGGGAAHVPGDKRRDVLVAILGSNCGGRNNRWDYVRELQKHVQVDVYGKCGTLQTCPGGFKANCHDIDSYMFYLAFENSNCDEYVTEKTWWNAYGKGSIPVIMGTSRERCKRLLPPHSYLHVDDFAKPSDLADFMLYLNATGIYRDYYGWTRDFDVLNEHGYFQSRSYHFCRVCEALNYNDRSEKVYGNLSEFWNVQKDCQPSWKTT